MNFVNDSLKNDCSKGRNYLKNKLKKAISRLSSMAEQSYVLAGGPYRSWAGFLIRQEGGEWGRLVLVLQR